jgi:hypothetical protein
MKTFVEDLTNIIVTTKTSFEHVVTEEKIFTFSANQKQELSNQGK